MAFQPEEDLSCSICQDIFKDPLVLSCSHSFCKDCLRSWWREKPTQDCPVCKRRSSRSDPPRNLALRNLCEAYIQQREKKEETQKASEEQLCQVHSEKLKLFCLSDQQPVCVVCRDSKVHEGHRFRPIAEAAQDLREELDKSLLPLKENLQKAKDLKEKFKGKADWIKKQARYTETQIEKQFLKLHNFLSEQQEARIKALREEEEQKTRTMKDKMAAVSREIEALSESIRATEEQLRAPDVSFLLKYKAAVERVQHCPLLEEEPQLDPGARIDRAKHLGNLSFNIWTSMKTLVHFTPVILDPNSAHNAVLSEDLSSFTRDQVDQEEEGRAFAFGSQGFDSGSHSWDIEVGSSEDWELGVSEDLTGKTENLKIWDISFFNGKYSVGSQTKAVVLKLDSNPQKITLCLDCDTHQLSFYDFDTRVHIRTITKISEEKLYPFFYTKSKYPIRILPKNIMISECCEK